jgi:PAS domain S-box-containing protein
MSKPTYDELIARIKELEISEIKHKNVEDELLKSEEKYRDLSDLLPQIVFESDVHGNLSYLNKEGLKSTGYTTDDVKNGITAVQLVIPEDRERVATNIQKVLAGEQLREEYTVLRKDQSTYPIIVYVSSIVTNGIQSGMRGTIVDISYSKTAEKALRASEEKLHRKNRDLNTFINSIPDMAWFKDTDSNFMIVNQAFGDAVGMDPDYLVNNSCEVCFGKEAAQHFKDDDRKVIESGKRTVFEESIQDADGNVIWLETIKSPYYDEDGTILGTIGVARNINDRKNAEEALRTSEELLKRKNRDLNTFINSIPDMAWFKDTDSNFMIVNQAFGNAVGMDPEYLVNNSCEVCFGKEAAQHFKDDDRKVIESGKRTVFEESIQDADGNVIWLETIKSPYYDEDGTILGTIGVARNINDRKNAEEALRASESSLRKAQEVAHIGSWHWHFDTDIIDLSEELHRIFEIPQDTELSYASWQTGIHPDDREFSDEAIRKAVAGDVPFDTTFRIITPSNVIIYIHSVAEVGRDEDGKPVNMFGIAQDITERRTLEEQLRIRQRMDSLGTLAGGIAHDFNNILFGIMGNINLLNMDNDNLTEGQKEFLSDADQSCIRAANLIRQFQTLSRGAIRSKSAVDVYDISHEVFTLLKSSTNRLIEKKITFEKGEYFVKADSGEVHQVLLNLATNSAQAIDERGAQEGDYIRISAEYYTTGVGDKTGLSVGEYIHISFEDTGVGMSGEVMTHAFDPMFTTKGKSGRRGQGLGLAMVYNIVSRIYSGHMHCESVEGKGSTFHIFLPKATPDTEVESTPTIDIKGGTETIMVIDDEPIIIKLVSKLLKSKGYTVVSSIDGKEALQIFAEKHSSIDAVILDLSMPHMSGQQVFQMMLDINPFVKVIVSSGHSDDYSTEGVLARAKGNIGKPYNVNNLAILVRSVLDS